MVLEDGELRSEEVPVNGFQRVQGIRRMSVEQHHRILRQTALPME